MDGRGRWRSTGGPLSDPPTHPPVPHIQHPPHPPSSCDLSSRFPLRLLRSNRTRQETRGSHGGEPSVFLERGRECDVCWRCCCCSLFFFFSLLDFSVSVKLTLPFPCSRPRSSLPLSLSLSLYFGSLAPPSSSSLPPSLLFLPSSPSVSSPQLFSSLLWHNIRSEPFVLSPPLLFSSPPHTPQSRCQLVKGESRVVVAHLRASRRPKWPG